MQVSAMTNYSIHEHFNYGYGKAVQPVQLLYTYGMHFANNPFAVINIP